MYYLIKRSITLFFSIFLVSFITFAVFQVIPGDPALTILGIDAEQGQIDALKANLNLDRPLAQRFFFWVKGVFSGDLGESLRFSQPVYDLIISRLPVTISVSLFALAITIILGLPLAVLAARLHGKWIDFFINFITQLGMGIPSFWVGILLILFFGLSLKWFAPGGYVPWHESLWGALRSLFLPSLAIAIPQTAVLLRYLRTSILEQIKMDYIRTAYSKGLKERIVLYKHVLKNALIPVVTILGLMITDFFAGSIIIEQVFALPGIGRFLVGSISHRDFPLVQGIVLYIAIIITVINFLVDIIYTILDPRIRYDR